VTIGTDAGEVAFTVARYALAAAGSLFLAYLLMIVVLVVLSAWRVRR
jgi:hypothetical protein